MFDTEVCVWLWQEHKACVGMSEVEARYKYTHMARSLKTYGITFFLVKVMYPTFNLFFCYFRLVITYHIIS